MRNSKKGSLLIVTLIAVSVITLLALSLSMRIHSETILDIEHSYTRETRHGCLNAAILCASERLVCDTNAFDAIAEDWAKPWERRADEWVLRVSGSGWSNDPNTTVGLIDESSKISINTENSALLASLISIVSPASNSSALELAKRIARRRPIVIIDQLRGIEGITDQLLSALAPHITYFDVNQINLNTADEIVMQAVINCYGRGSSAATQSLISRIKAFRNSGYYFTYASESTIAKSLGGLPASELELLANAMPGFSVKSNIFSGIAEATPARYWESNRKPGYAVFTFDRNKSIFLRWIDF